MRRYAVLLDLMANSAGNSAVHHAPPVTIDQVVGNIEFGLDDRADRP
jgi:hypothetical protein